MIETFHTSKNGKLKVKSDALQAASHSHCKCVKVK